MLGESDLGNSETPIPKLVSPPSHFYWCKSTYQLWGLQRAVADFGASARSVDQRTPDSVFLHRSCWVSLPLPCVGNFEMDHHPRLARPPTSEVCEGKHRQSLDQNLVIQISSEELIFQAFHCHFSSQDWSPSALMTNQMHMDIHWLLLRQTVAPRLLVQCRNLTKFRKRDQPTQASCTMLVSGSFFGDVRTIKKKLKS